MLCLRLRWKILCVIPCSNDLFVYRWAFQLWKLPMTYEIVSSCLQWCSEILSHLKPLSLLRTSSLLFETCPLGLGLMILDNCFHLNWSQFYQFWINYYSFLGEKVWSTSLLMRIIITYWKKYLCIVWFKLMNSWFGGLITCIYCMYLTLLPQRNESRGPQSSGFRWKVHTVMLHKIIFHCLLETGPNAREISAIWHLTLQGMK